jgi:hypothetical protein
MANEGGLKVDTNSLVGEKVSVPPGVGAAPSSLRLAATGLPTKQAKALNDTAAALQNHQTYLQAIWDTLRQPPKTQRVYVTDGQGKVVAAIGDFIYPGTGIRGRNYFSEIHVGDPLGTGDPNNALFNANTDGSVVIGQNGWITVLDPFGESAAWLGTQADVLPVTGATNNGSGLIRLEVMAHTLLTGDITTVYLTPGDVAPIPGGISNGTGIWTVTKVDANHIDLQNSVFVGAYTAGGTVNRVLHIEAITNNGSGLIRIKITNHGYESGDKVNLVGTGILGLGQSQWVIHVPQLGGPLHLDPDHFDLLDSTYVGGYTLGTCLRYFAGGLFQTIAIGSSFADYKLRAFADGELKIRNALITLIATDPGTGEITGEIILDPSVPQFLDIAFVAGVPVQQVRINGGLINVELTDSDGNPLPPRSEMEPLGFRIIDALGNPVGSLLSSGNQGTLIVNGDGTGFQVSVLGGSAIVNAFGPANSVVVDGGAGNVTATGDIESGADGTGLFRCRGFNGVDTVLKTVDTITITTGTAVTGVTGPGVSSVTTGPVVTAVTISTLLHTVKGGIVVS